MAHRRAMSAPARGTASAIGEPESRPMAACSGAESQSPAHTGHVHAAAHPSSAAADCDGAAAESEGSSGSDGSMPATRLYRHALESIFAFLDLHETAQVLRVSRDWMAAVQSMASLGWAVKNPAVSIDIGAMSASLMARHVTLFGSSLDLMPLSLAALPNLACRMPQLRGLHCWLQGHLPPGDSLMFPPRLRTLGLWFTCSGTASAPVINAVLQAASRLPLLESFVIQLPAFDAQLSFAPLASLPQLRDLRIAILGTTHTVVLSDAQVAELRAIQHLRRLCVHPMTTSLLRRLLAQPHELQWQSILPLHELDDAAAALLAQLPSLTALDSRSSCSRFHFLRGLPNLGSVRLTFSTSTVSGPVLESLAAGLQCCRQMTRLHLIADLTAEHFAALLPRLPLLQSLSLNSRALTSLAFLCQPAVVHSLRSLHLYSCRQLSLSELQHVHSLRGLTALRLCRCFATPMDAHDQSLYMPPSALLPQLESFSYTVP